MFPIHAADGSLVPLNWGIVDPTVLNAAGSTSSDIIEIDGFSVRDIFSGQVEPYPDRNDFEAYRVHHSNKIIRITGVIRKDTHQAALNAFRDLAGAFDPNVLYMGDLTSSGFQYLHWTLGDGYTHYYMARPIQTPDLIWNKYLGSNIPFTIDLIAEPYRYVNNLNTAVASGSTLTNEGDAVSDTFYIHFTLSGAGPASWTAGSDRWDGPDMELDLSSISSGTVKVDMAKREVTHNDNAAPQLITTPGWFPLYPGDNVLTFTGGSYTSPNVNRFLQYWSK